jgi:DNA-binding XRE family transcriptional regulator
MASAQVGFGRTVRALRAHAGYSQESFADAIGVHRTSMGTLERGEGDPKLSTIARIACGLDLSLGELFTAMEKDGDPARLVPPISPCSSEFMSAEADMGPGMSPLSRAPVLRPSPLAGATRRRGVAWPPDLGGPGGVRLTIG